MTDPLDLTTAALMMVDASGLIECWSPQAEKLLGYAAADVLGQPVSAVLYSPDGLSALIEGRLVADSWEGLISVRHHGGRTVELGLRVRALPTPGGGSRWLAALCGADALKRWELGQAALQGLLTQSPIGIAVLDAGLRFECFNEVLAAMEGLPAHDSGTCPVPHPELLRAVERQARRALSSGKLLSSVESVELPPETVGRPSPEHLRLRTSFPLHARTGTTLGVCQTAVDFTDHDRGRRRLMLVNEASERIGTTLDLGRTVQELAEVLVPRIADFAAVDLLDGVRPPEELAARPRSGRGGLYRAAHLSTRADHPEVIVPIGSPARYPVQSPQSRCLATGLTVRDPVLTLATSWLAKDPLRQEKLLRLGVHSHMTVPLRARGVTAGVVTLLRWENPEPFDDDDQLLVEELAARAAVCVDNARRFAREHSAALALQTSLLPPVLPDLSAVEVAYRYLPADAEAGVGGDWFDVIPLSGARVALVVGDVVGHGIHAAASMGRLRAAVQTLADIDLPPEELLTHVDDLVLRLSEEAEAAEDGPLVVGATCIYAVYDPIARKLRVARAGHPGPAIAHMREPVEILDVPAGPPLGLGGLPFESAEFEVEEGSVLVLFTDGLIEASDHDVDAGLERLCFALAHPDRPLEEICDTMVRTLLPDRPPDDVAILVVRTRSLSSDRVASWDIPSTPAAVAEARRKAVGQLARWNLDDMAFATELIVSELVTNALKHAHGPIGVRLIHDRTLVCEVSDASNTSPRLRRARYSDEGGRGLFLVAQLAQRWGTRYTERGKTIWTEQQPPPALDPDGTRSPG
ncbi:SpoIIE family protein phosphatase [Streptomyces sp. NPDC007905]|uniref:ATP-binding SpoIIE family protein phosphatase n=1 Tax=Streptomyces sp. NPDC007905 TaxID=3364788 RepID=UPI0036E58277